MNREKQKILLLVCILGLANILLISSTLHSETLVQEFKNPSFSGIGTSAAWLTQDEQQFSRNKDQIEKLENALEDAIREEENSTLNKFIRSLQSRVLSRMAQDITASLFDDTGGTGGEILIEGNRIEYSNDGESIILTVEAEDGSFTTIEIPIGIFGICSEDCVT